MRQIAGLLLLILIGLLTACQSADPLPTQIQLDQAVASPSVADTSSPSEDMTPSVVSATQTATPRPTRSSNLPPTFTPTPSETPDAVAVTDLPSPTPQGYNQRGLIYYLYNGDSVAQVNGDGTNNDIFLTFGVGLPLSDLRLAPDESLLSFVAPGGGSAREVYVSTLDGSYVQQVSCLGYSQVLAPIWTPDSQSLTFYAAQLPTSSGNIFSANVAGSGNCPQDNNQRILLEIQSPDYRDAAYNLPGTYLFYAGGGLPVYALDMSTLDRSVLVHDLGFGPNFRVAHHPTENRLAVLMTQFDRETGERPGALVLVNDTLTLPEDGIRSEGVNYAARDIRWSPQGTYLLVVSEDNLYYLEDQRVNVVFDTPLDATTAPEDAVFSFDETQIAYTMRDANGVEQIFVYDLAAGTTTQLTFNPEGTIEDLLWIASPSLQDN